jgi:TPR repeat protein
LDSGAKDVENELKDCLLSLAKEQYQAANYGEGTKTLSVLKEKLSVDLMQLEGSFLRGYGISLLQGNGVDKNINEAEKYLTKAYQAGANDVQGYLAELYLELSAIQEKTGKNLDSIESLRKSARYGSVKGQEQLYIREFESAAEGLKSGNIAMLKELETIATNKDNPRNKEARSLLEEHYYKSGQWQNAEKWLSMSVEDGNQDARPLLGRAQFEVAKSFTKDNQKSFKYLKAAYDNGHKNAGADLVDHYVSGLGCKANIEDAITIIEQLSFDNPASIPDETRIKFCKILRKKAQISKEEKDYTSAMKYYSKLSENDYNPDIGDRRAAISWVAHFYYHGHGVQKDEDKAIKLYEKASSLGEKNSSAQLRIYYKRLSNSGLSEKYRVLAEEQGYKWK